MGEIKPGVYDMSEAEYFADPCPEISLSASLARILLTESPAHAIYRARQPWNPLAGDWKFDAKAKGRAAHSMILEGKHGFTVLPADFEDFKTKAARELRDAARLQGSVPLLQHQYDSICAAVQGARHRIAKLDERPIPFTEGEPERVLIWQEPNGIWCRARLDWLRDDRRFIDDLKTTEQSAHPDRFGRYLWSNGYEMQEAFYRRGVKAVFGVDAAFRFVAVEMFGYQGCSVIELDSAGRMLAEERVDRAIRIWGECLERDEWPGYPRHGIQIETPGYLIAQHEAELMSAEEDSF